ncbi:ecto-ADP-ribosyltransferase 4-like [Poecilia latipinna]|uniref:NAD(P)(+)--arginine ADP-ribosyltransferase n=1 Tax=Poecilia latipinna TaxID=48699 RepID=A0A3B3VZU8_9TELE|nr:PREDICTED: ecto-ADP-ribosyltransferase 4-like [Poecilia latipinna]XP_014911813.1 PREDICTED: ecto-ADP-ribosyltransferase 4-like [Poecilia latipinna]XP_014911814.1 PREDICTED: ecto-ADP-ribosyltransferase 4-like [Poecilia latipinna]XP_014911815.1 PREDICTED: ecto-ADP-ribosyltransferase 4-like [Poecilia latipinna]XP_014911816.1 PREDICTED: ecto-ADP-ribosyltransferase 4-like [Poecilia latipinna]
MMPSQKRQQKGSACVIASLVVLEGLLVVFVIYICLSWRDTVGESSQHLTSDLDGDKFAGCTTKVAVLNDEAMKQKWHTCSAHFSKAWSKAEQHLKEPADKYMEKSHSLALNMFTAEVLKRGNKNSEAAERTPKQRRAFEPVSLYSSLSEAILILKQNQVMCLSTNYRTETVLELNVSTGLVRFSTFILGCDRWDSDGNVSCFDVYSCFGANVTKYSVLKGNNQVLIPPYEVFTVTDVQKQTSSCKITYKLKSNLNCVYDEERNQLHSISVLPAEGFWLIVTIICFVLLLLLLLCVIVKLYWRISSAGRVSNSHSTVQSHYSL